MYQQVLVIHGGMAYDSYEDYLEDLAHLPFDLDDLKPKAGWKLSLIEELGAEFDVFLPRMPSKQNAKYSEWKIYFERIFEKMDDDAILVGHSLGGIFLAKYLAEEKIEKKIKATILVAAPYDDASDESLGTFTLPDSLALFEEQGGLITLFQSKDDPIVPEAEVEKYHEQLPEAVVVKMMDRLHFNQESFPELVETIKGIQKTPE